MNEQIAFYQQKLAYEIDSADLFQALENNQNLVVIDTRQPHGFERQHIPGAVNLPHAQMTEATTQHLDHNTLYVCYCDGIGCNGSTKGALKMTKLGFKVKELMGGIEWWKQDGYATEGTEATQGAGIQCAC